MLMLLHAQSIANSSLTILYHLRCYHSLDVPNIYSQDGWTPLMVASFKGHADIVRLLTDYYYYISNDVTSVLVKFDNGRVGLKSIQTSPHRARFAHSVPLNKYEVVFFAKGKRGSEIKRLQFTSMGNHNTQSSRLNT